MGIRYGWRVLVLLLQKGVNHMEQVKAIRAAPLVLGR